MYDLKNKNILDLLNVQINDIVKHNDHSASFKLFKNIENQIIKNSTDFPEDFLEKIDELLLILKFIILYKFSDNDVAELLSKHFDKIFEIENYDIFSKINDFLTNYENLYERDRVKEKILKALSSSRVLITKATLELNTNIQNGTIENWLKDFRTEFMEKGFLDLLNINNYISSNKNYIKLDDKEKNKVEILLKFYNKISRTSFDFCSTL